MKNLRNKNLGILLSGLMIILCLVAVWQGWVSEWVTTVVQFSTIGVGFVFGSLLVSDND